MGYSLGWKISPIMLFLVIACITNQEEMKDGFHG